MQTDVTASARPSGDEGPSLAELAAALRPDDEQLGLRERKKRARREALIDATHRLVETHGLDAVTVEAICDEAGVSVRTFFNYFESKDDAVLGHTPWSLDTHAAEVFVAGGPTGHLLDDLAALMGAALDEAPLRRDRLARVLELAAREPRLLAAHHAWIERHKGLLVDVIGRRLGDAPQRDPGVVAALAIFLSHAAFMRWDAAGGHGGGAAEHLAAVVTELRALVDD